MRTLLITGGLGFIGSHTCIELVKKGYSVYIVDSLKNSHFSILNRIRNILKEDDQNISRIKFFKGDMRNKNFLNSVFEKATENGDVIEGVIHFAGLKSVHQSLINPLEYWSNNIIPVLNLIDIMQLNKTKNIIFSSSAAVYSPLNKSPINERGNLGPISPYGKTKYCIEEILMDIFKSTSESWRIVNLRYFNPIGAHPSGLIGEMPMGIPNNIFPLINNVASRQIDTLKIFGNDWDTKDGTPVRDYIHVMDLVHGHIMAYEHIIKEKSQVLTLNLGTGKGTSVLELINTFQKVNNVNVPYVFVKKREGDLSEIFADNSLAFKLFGWYPKKNLSDMCKDGWKWQNNCLINLSNF